MEASASGTGSSMMRSSAVICTILAAASAFGQIHQLATTHDGEQVVFLHRRSPFGGDEPAGARVFRYAEGQLRPFQVPYATLDVAASNWYTARLSVTGDGGLIGMSIWAICGRCMTSPLPRSAIVGRGEERFYLGDLDLSQNGRYAQAGGMWFDLETGRREGPMPDAGIPRGGIADDGAVVTRLNGELRLWHPDRGFRELRNAWPAVLFRISAAGGHVVFQSMFEPGYGFALVSLDLASGEERPLYADPDRGSLPGWFSGQFRFAVSADGRWVIFTGRDGINAPVQLRLIESTGSGHRVLAEDAAGFTDVALSGDGRVAWVVVGGEQLLRFDVETGTQTRVAHSSDLP